MRSDALLDARNLVRKTDVGVISTLSHNLRGYPFGSVSPYFLDSAGRAIFYISDIAQHAKNLSHDTRMSLTVFTQKEQGDQNAHGRVTLVGDAAKVSDDEQDALKAQYVRMYPAAKQYEEAHDFHIWRMDIARVRYIGGFGKIFWLEKDEWLAPESPWNAEAEKSMVEHMNEDHQDAMELILAMHTGVIDKAPLMSGIVSEGCYIQSGDCNYYIPFPTPCTKQGDVRKVLVELTQQARAAA